MTRQKPTRAAHILDRVRRVGGGASLAGGYMHCRLPDSAEGYELLREIRHSRAAVIANLRASGSGKRRRTGTTMIAESEPLDAVLERAVRGVPVTQGLGPFFVVVSWPSSSRRLVCPIEFPTVEDACLRFVECFPQLEDSLEADFVVNICLKSASTLVQ